MLLDFEKPIADLEAKLAEMKQQLDVERNEDLRLAVRSFEDNILKLKRETFQNLTRWQRVQLSRHGDRPTTLDYLYSITTQFIELHGDRSVRDDQAMVGGLAPLTASRSCLSVSKKAGIPNKGSSVILVWPIRKATARPCGS